MKELTDDLKYFCENDSKILNKSCSVEYPNKAETTEFNYNNFLRNKLIKKYQKK